MVPRRFQRQALDSDRIRTRLRMFRRTRLPQTMPPSASYQQPFNVSMLPSAHMKASAPTTKLFRGSITRPAHPLSTLRSVSYLTTT